MKHDTRQVVVLLVVCAGLETNMYNQFKPYIFKDLDKQSETYNQWSIRWSETMSIDGYPTYEDALSDLYIKVTNKAIQEGIV